MDVGGVKNLMEGLPVNPFTVAVALVPSAATIVDSGWSQGIQLFIWDEELTL